MPHLRFKLKEENESNKYAINIFMEIAARENDNDEKLY